MKYAVLITPEAQRNITSGFEYILAHSKQNAASWLNGAYKRINSLELLPNRCGEARERKYLPGRQLRQLTYKSHRIIFEVDDAELTVSVLYVRHGKMRAIGDVESDS